MTRAHLASIGLGVLGALLVVVSSFLEWTSLGDVASLKGIEANGGKVMLVMAIIAIALLIVSALFNRLPRAAGILTTTLGLFIALIAGLNMDDTDSLGFSLPIGPGLYLGLVGGLVVAVGGVLLVIADLRSRSTSSSD